MSEIRFGLQVTLSRISWYAYSNADFVVVGRLFGSARLGDYSVAWTLASVPVDRISGILTRVMPAVMSASNDDPAEVKRYICRLTEGVSLVVFPLAFGTALVARDFVTVALGAKWIGAIPLLQLLSVGTACRVLVPVLNHALLAIGRPDLGARFNLLAALTLPALFLAGSPWGPAGVASGWLLGYPLLAAVFMLRWTMRETGLGCAEYLASLWPATSCTAAMVLAVAGIGFSTPGLEAPLRLGLLIAGGAGTYGGLAYLLHRDRMTAAIRSFVG
jgi:O-antigen/teichoic acid export membrane protein